MINGYCNYVPFIQEKNPCFTDHYQRHRHQYHHIIIDITVRADEIHKSTTSEPHTPFSSRIILRLPECYQKTENDNYFAFFPHLILASFNFVTQPFRLVQSCCTPKKQTHEKRGEKTSIRKDIVERFSGFRNTFETVQLTYELSLRVISAVVVVNV